jgi:hypothetical protein
MQSPYSALPDYCFWRRSMSVTSPEDVDPVVSVPFGLSPQDKIATAGSCFAQHIARTLVAKGFHYFVTEAGDLSDNYGVFSARYGNIYTVKQLLQLFQRAYGLFHPAVTAWRREDGAYIDPFRPQIQDRGFASVEDLERDRSTHLTAVREMFESCDVFIFTLGLTEGWQSTEDGATIPLPPGAAKATVVAEDYVFRNFPVDEMATDLVNFIGKLRVINPHVRIILTVSPVPLIATYEDRHVLVSTIYSKSALRVVAEMVTQQADAVSYFPSYEIITGHHTQYRFFEPDLRSVSPAGVDSVMRLFAKHFMSNQVTPAPRIPEPAPRTAVPEAFHSDPVVQELYKVVCDEEVLDQ